MEGNNQNLLIVDDDELNRKLLRGYLLSVGYRVLEAHNGEEAIEKATEDVDLILLDLLMPGMDGFEICRRLKGRSETRNVPVIFLSALQDPRTKVSCLDIGGADYVSKPFEIEEVLARIKTHLILRQRECQLRDYTLRLEQMVEERTRQLIHADRLATLGTFSAGIAHEIRNPLTGINACLYNLEEICEAEDMAYFQMETVREITRQLQAASNKIESVIKRILNYSKPITPRMTSLNICNPVDEAIKLASVGLKKKGITLLKSFQEKIPDCYADPVLIEQVILNLIQNAARIMEGIDGLRKICVECTARDDRVIIKVSDSGPGVPRELREKIFDPFFTTHSDGCGLGLSIVLRVINDHCGTIKVETSKWDGAEFSIELPVNKRRTSS